MSRSICSTVYNYRCACVRSPRAGQKWREKKPLHVRASEGILLINDITQYHCRQAEKEAMTRSLRRLRKHSKCHNTNRSTKILNLTLIQYKVVRSMQ